MTNRWLEVHKEKLEEHQTNRSIKEIGTQGTSHQKMQKQTEAMNGQQGEDTSCVPIQGLHTLSAHLKCNNVTMKGVSIQSVLQMHPTNALCFYLFLECAPLLPFMVSHIPRFIARPKRRKK